MSVNKIAPGLFEYSPEEIKPECIIFELIHDGLVSGPITRRHIFVCQDLLHVAETCETILKDYLECEFIDKETYVLEDVLADDELDGDVDPDYDSIVDQWIKKFKDSITGMQNTQGSNQSIKFSELKNILDDFGLGSEIGVVCTMQEYVDDPSHNNFLLRQLDEEESLTSIDELSLPGNEDLISQAINFINTYDL